MELARLTGQESSIVLVNHQKERPKAIARASLYQSRSISTDTHTGISWKFSRRLQGKLHGNHEEKPAWKR